MLKQKDSRISGGSGGSADVDQPDDMYIDLESNRASQPHQGAFEEGGNRTAQQDGLHSSKSAAKMKQEPGSTAPRGPLPDPLSRSASEARPIVVAGLSVRKLPTAELPAPAAAAWRAAMPTAAGQRLQSSEVWVKGKRGSRLVESAARCRILSFICKCCDGL